METINIIFSSDDNYAQYMGVSICSIFENKIDGYLINIYVLDGGISKENIIKLTILEEKYSFEIKFIQVNSLIFNEFYTSRHITKAAYYRIIIPNLFPNLKKVLYLDCDTIVIGNVLELYKININNYYFAAVEDLYMGQARHNDLNIPLAAKYFNSGVMLINLERWRNNNLSQLILNFIKNSKIKLEFHDQDAINANTFNKWLNLPLKFNYMSTLFNKNDLNNKKQNILIIHYTGLKPWNYFSHNYFNTYYFYYLSKTPWKNKKYINKSFKNTAIIFLESIILFMFPKKVINIIKKIKLTLGIKFY